MGPEAKGKLWLGLTGEMLPASDSISAATDAVGERSASGQALSTALLAGFMSALHKLESSEEEPHLRRCLREHGLAADGPAGLSFFN